MTVRLLFGTDPAALEAAARSEYVRSLQSAQAARDPGRLLWITPTARSRKAVLRRLTDAVAPPCVGPGVQTFEQFAEFLLHAAGRPATAISSMVRRLILRRLVREALAAGSLRYFAGVAHTAGFLDIVESFIAELKRDEIWPERFLELCEQHSETADRDREIGQLYQQYQAVLHEQNGYDTEGRFWLARRLLLDGECRRLPAWSHVAVVGFADFTPPQREILEELSRRSEQLLLTVPGDPDDDRRDLFAKPAQTGAQWRARFPQAEAVRIEGLADEPAARHVLREGLFGNLRERTPVANGDAIELVAATGPESELSAVGIRIKALLQQGYGPQDIVVGAAASEVWRWTQGLQKRGLPAWCDTGPPLREAGLVKFVIAVLLAELEDWPFNRLQAVLNSSYFRPVGDVATDGRSVATSLRRLRLSSDRQAILKVLPATTATVIEPDDDTALDADTNWPVVHAAAGRCLRWYSRVTEPLRTSRPLVDWLDLVAEIVQQFGAIDRTSFDPIDVADVALWERLQRTLRDAAAMDARQNPSPPALDLAEFLAEFRDLLASEYREPEQESPGVLRVLSLEQVRHLDAPVLVLVGLTEDSFPRSRGDDCLFPDAERRRLTQAGLPMRSAAQHQQDDLFLFYTLLQRWQQRLLLTYAAVNPRGQPTFPSPYVTAMRSLFTDDSLQVQREGQLDPIPDATHMLTAADQRLAAWEAARTGHPGWLRTVWEQSQATSANVVAAVEMAVQRFHTPGFTAYEGRLTVEANRQAVAQRFGVQRQFSATELEAYANCPFRFWLETGLGIEPVAPVEVGTNHRERGSLVHAVLSKLTPEFDAGPSRQALADRFRELVAERLQKTVSATDLQRALTRVERQLLDQWAAAYAEQCGLYADQIAAIADDRWQVLDTEYPFGDVPGATNERKAPPLTFGRSSNQVQVRGRIDRVDVGRIQDRPAFIVIDYKTGRRPKFSEDDVRNGTALQLMLYTIAVRRLGLAPADALPFQLGYWCLKETGFEGGVGRKAKELKPIDAAVWETLERLVDDIVPKLAAGIRRGEFVVDNPEEQCTGMCEFRTVCRVNQIRPLQEKLHKVRAEPVLEAAPPIEKAPARKSKR